MAQPHEQGNETVLRKYPNRRIYDPTRNCHVTLSELADRVKQGERIRIVDNQSGEDITHLIMGQVLYETLKTRPDYLPLDLVLLMIRAQDNVIRDFLFHWLPQSFQAYLETQRRMASGISWMNQGFPFTGLFPMGSAGFGTGNAAPQPTPSAGNDAIKQELDLLRSEVEALKQSNSAPSGTGKKKAAKED